MDISGHELMIWLTFLHNLHLLLHVGSCPESRWCLLIRNLVGIS